MGKRSSSKSNKKPGKKDSPLRKSFDKNKKKHEVNGPTRLFLTYLKSAMKGKNETSQAQATALHTYYARLTIQGEKGVISEFFRQGGKKQGLQSIFHSMWTVRIWQKMANGMGMQIGERS